MMSKTGRIVAQVCVALLSLVCAAQGGDAAEALAGLWSSEQMLGPLVRGELTIEARKAEWHARIGGYEVPVERDRAEVRFVLPGSAGEFRGHLDQSSKTIVGHWIQPPGAFYNQFYSRGFTSPVRLAEVSSGVWRGQVVPLDERVSFYISIQRAVDGSVTAFIRNPEANWFSGRNYKVEVKKSAVELVDGNTQLRGTYDAETDRLTLPILANSPVQFIRQNGRTAVGFYPRLSGGGKYVYRKPLVEDDGWETASLAEVGLDERRIAALIEKILTADAADNPVNFQGLLIARHGKLVLEEYFYGFDKERPHDMRSASKTFAPVLVGIARDRGVKIGADTPVYPLFPEYKPFANWEERKNRITLRDLMTMTSGHACDDRDDTSPGSETTMLEQTRQPDWYKYTLDLPMAREPGAKDAIYCSAATNLTGGAVRNAAGKWLPQLFDEYIARPLQIHRYHMNLMPTGEAYAGGGLYLRPRDQLKLGQVYLSGGLWKGRRVVSQEWVKASTAVHASFKPVRELPDLDVNHGYGYAWHVRTPRAASVPLYYYAGGNGGQYVIVIPELDMVVGMTGGSYTQRRKFYRWEIELLPQYIIAAAQKQRPPVARRKGHASTE